MKRIIAMLLVVLLIFSGCGKNIDTTTGDGGQTADTEDEGQLDAQERGFSLVYDPEKSMNPYTCVNYTNKVIFSLLYQSLFTVDSDYNVEPQLCKSYTVSKDKKTYVFYLEDATFGDGTALTVTDALVSLETACNSDVYSGRLTNVESLSVTEDGGLQIQLSCAYENFPMLLDIPIVKAEQVDAEMPEGTGPYTLERTTTGFELRLRKKWWCKADLPISETVIPLVEFESTKQARDEFELGDVGLVCTDPSSDSYVDYRSSYDLWACESGTFLYIGCRAKSSVFSNETVRQALTYAIDRASLSLEYYNTFAQAATLPASPSSPYYNEALAAEYAYDPERFMEALAQEELEGSSITLLVNKDDSHRVKVANAIAAMLEECSLVVTVKALSTENYIAALRYGNFDLYLGQTVLSPNMDLTAFYSKSGALAYGGISNTEIANLCQKALANSDYYDELYQAVMTYAMLCPVAFLSYGVYVRDGYLEDPDCARDHVFYYSLGKTMEDALITQ